MDARVRKKSVEASRENQFTIWNLQQRVFVYFNQKKKKGGEPGLCPKSTEQSSKDFKQDSKKGFNSCFRKITLARVRKKMDGGKQWPEGWKYGNRMY